jgi:hypothetical protein
MRSPCLPLTIFGTGGDVEDRQKQDKLILVAGFL